MALELKGLKANMMKLQARVDRLNSLAVGADEKGAMLEGHLGDVGKQLGSHVDDIEFAANVLGNSGGGFSEAGESVEKSKPPPATEPPPDANAQTTAPASPEGRQPPPIPAPLTTGS